MGEKVMTRPLKHPDNARSSIDALQNSCCAYVEISSGRSEAYFTFQKLLHRKPNEYFWPKFLVSKAGTELVVGIHESNLYKSLIEMAGLKDQRSRVIFRRKIKVMEVTFGWENQQLPKSVF
ncbi:hypothetical protein LOAG_12162 [Loa loa]|uniref:Uncharacterized protein n=1 Tax=Loa loa TaxID=7209 RepID=A0A1S0TLQ2_LOALO|nr:hypothetical protein LOAG_12162 [Loa loa]EFO16344.1 hypothetical protein LOAG_12162 [Loa loa]